MKNNAIVLPKRTAPVLFGLILSGFMSLMVSGVSTLTARGAGPGFMPVWMAAWLGAWAFAFPAVLIVAPVARQMVQWLTREA